jgi:hypothetical protein
MIEKVGNVEQEEVGFYAGLIESLFSATQMCVMILWGKVCVVSHFVSTQLIVVGLRSIRKKTSTSRFFDRNRHRNDLVRYEPVPLADDCSQMFCWRLCWYRCYCSSYA